MIYRGSYYQPKYFKYLHAHLPNNSVYLDIETTGLSRRSAIIYLIGCAHFEKSGNLRILQWFAENPDEEKTILLEFSEYIKKFSCLCHYNGTQFDLPFLAHRFGLYQIPDPCREKESRDLYRLLKPCQKILSLPGLKQQDLENFLHLKRPDSLTGGECVSLYRNLVKYRDHSYADPLLLHNLEDIQGLTELESMHAYLSVLNGNFTLWETTLEKEQLKGLLHTERAVPRPVFCRYETPSFSLDFNEKYITASISLEKGLLKNYYADCKNYYYLPEEDTAIHKSVGSYVDKSRRRPADRQTCYTKFHPTDAFLCDMQEVEKYFRNNLPLLLKLL